VSNGFAAGLIRRRLIAGTYFLAVTDTGGRYDGDTFEADNSFEDATLIHGGFTQTRSIAPAGDVDHIKFHLSAKDTIVLKTTGSLKTRIALYDHNYTNLAISNGYRDGFIRKMLESGTYYAAIYRWVTRSPRVDEYKVHFSTTVEHEGEPVESSCNQRSTK